MKKYLPYIVGFLLAACLFAAYQSQAAFVPISVPAGGTGSTTAATSGLGGILAGNGTSAVKSVVIGSNITFDGTTLSASAGGGSFPFTPATDFSVNTSATTTAIWGQNSVFASSTSATVPALAGSNSNATGLALLTGGGVVGFATTTPGQTSKFGVEGGGFFNGTIYASNFVDTAVTGNNCIGETNGLLGTSNCVASIASADSSLTVSSPTGNVDLSLNLAHTNIFTAHQIFGSLFSTIASTTNATTTGTLAIPVGAAVITPSSGNIAIDTTSGQLRYSDGTTRVFSGFSTIAFGYSTTTWTGTTTFYLAPAKANITVVNVSCETNAGTLGVSLYDGTNRADYIPTASTTINTNAYTTNNAFTTNETMRLDVGTPASSPTNIACRFKYVYDQD